MNRTTIFAALLAATGCLVPMEFKPEVMIGTVVVDGYSTFDYAVHGREYHEYRYHLGEGGLGFYLYTNIETHVTVKVPAGGSVSPMFLLPAEDEGFMITVTEIYKDGDHIATLQPGQTFEPTTIKNPTDDVMEYELVFVPAHTEDLQPLLSSR